MNSIPYILATAGHVDHGKSVLVRALTGIEPDRLAEEKARGITIELGFTHFYSELDDLRFQIGVIDVPGHEDFVKNMVAGVGTIDAALLVVAADDGWMPQTEEHVQILEYFGVKKVVIALTKIDLCDAVEETIESVRQKLKGSAFANAAIVPVSVPTNSGVDELKGALATMFSQCTPQPDIGKPRVAVDRKFHFKGLGTIVTGTLVGGAMRREQSVIIEPRGKSARVRSMQTHNREVSVALPGSRVAINVSDVQSGEVSRGDVLVAPDRGVATDTWDVVVERSPRATMLRLKAGARVQVHHGTAVSAARIVFLDHGAIAAGEWRIGQLRLDAAAFAFAGDRFVIRDWSEQQTLLGGIVLDPLAARHRWRSRARREFLQDRAENPENAARFIETALRGAGLVDRTKLLIQSRFGDEAINAAVTNLVNAGKVVVKGDRVADAQWWAELRDRVVTAIDREHREHPERAGLNLAELRAAVANDGAEAVIEELCCDGFVRAGTTIRRTGFHPALPPRLREAGEKLRAALAARKFDPPSRKELTPDALSQQAMKFLVINGEAVEVGADAVLTASAMGEAVQIIQRHIRRHGPATVSDLKTALNSSRRIMVPLLEKLDRDGVTKREGDRRTLRTP